MYCKNCKKHFSEYVETCPDCAQKVSPTHPLQYARPQPSDQNNLLRNLLITSAIATAAGMFVAFFLTVGQSGH